MTFCVGSSLHKRRRLSRCDAPPPKSPLPLSLIFLFPLKASAFTSTRSPGFKFTAPIFLFAWACASYRAVLNLSHMEATYSYTCLAEASLVGASLLQMVGKT